MQKNFEDQFCNTEGAFQKGYNEANSGEKMNNYWANQCPQAVQAEVRKSYREGFVQAASHKHTQINIINPIKKANE